VGSALLTLRADAEKARVWILEAMNILKNSDRGVTENTTDRRRKQEWFVLLMC
jgi:hypothetical protein